MASQVHVDEDRGVIRRLLVAAGHLGVGWPCGWSRLAATPEALAEQAAAGHGRHQVGGEEDVVQTVPDATGIKGAGAWTRVKYREIIATDTLPHSRRAVRSLRLECSHRLDLR